ncbi:MAG: phosphatase PAP2 family protein [Melioribacteraceae bacterium]
MIDILYSIDVFFLYFINKTLSNPLFDKFFPFITDVKNWYLVYFVLLGICFKYGGRKGKLAVLVLPFLILASDQFSSFFLKNLFERVRPCNVFSDIHVLVNCTGSYSFPSSHAVNNFSAAMFFSKLFPKIKIPLFVTASIVAFSRPYVGVHYPSDILGGMLIGLGVGYIFSLLVLEIDKFTNKKFSPKADK